MNMLLKLVELRIYRWEELEKAVLYYHIRQKKIPVESSMIVSISLSIIYTALD